MSFLGMRGTEDWGADQRPKSWRESILYLYPNGAAPLTGLLSKIGKGQKVTDPQFHWWTKQLENQRGAVTNIYTDSIMSAAYTSGGVAGTILYVKIAAATIAHFRIGHQVLLRDASDPTVDVIAKVVAREENGASSCLTVKLLEADDNSSLGDLSDADVIMRVGSINPEGGTMPDPIAYDPTKWYNFTQIFRNSLSISRTAQATKLRTGDAYKEAKRETLEYHSIDMEKAFLFGVPSEGTGDNGMPERTMLGLVPAIRGGYTGHGGTAGTVSHFPTAQAGNTWLSAGEDWMDEQLEIMFRYGQREKLMFCGSGTLLAINKLVKAYGSYEFTPKTKSYGIQVTEWVTPFGTINMVNHPLFSMEATLRNSAVIFEPQNLKYNYIDDTKFYAEGDMQNTGSARLDGKSEEFLTECSLEYHHPISWGYLTGFGTDG